MHASATRPVQLDVNGFFSHVIGSRGFAVQDVELLIPRLTVALESLTQRRSQGELPFYDLPYDEDSIGQCRSLGRELAEEFDDLVVLGIGGSALGTKAVLDAIAPARRSKGLRVHVADNIDPTTFADLLSGLVPARTAFNVISKSGGTAETAAQFLIVRQWLIDGVGEPGWKRNVVMTTDPEKGPLRVLAEREGFRSLPVPPGVGGRFSVLTAVGLLPLAAAGIDIGALCAGARHADTLCSQSDPWQNPAALHAGLLFLAMQEGCNIHVLMPYCDALLRLAEWYAQLWAESLGKARTLDGSVAEVGQTPVRALGATDQHSQVQLYIEGPHDKVVTFLRVERTQQDLSIPSSPYGLEELDYLSGHTLGELLNMEQRATELALAESGRMTSVIELEAVDEPALGYLFQLFEVQTLVTGTLLHIDPLDQPGVEAGKRLTFAMAGRSGYGPDAERVARMLERKRPELVLG